MSVNIDGNEFIFSNENASGGFSVNLMLKKMGMSPLVTLKKGGANENNLTDLFGDSIVVPNWLLTLNDKTGGNKYNHDKAEDDDEDEDINDDTHDKLLKLVNPHSKSNTKKTTRRLLKKSLKKTRKTK